jgi:hypothetical protein
MVIVGLPLYVASASFMRHTMNALYTDLAMTLVKVSLETPTSKGQDTPGSAQEQALSQPEKKRSLREKSLHIRFIATGKARVSGSSNEWEV